MRVGAESKGGAGAAPRGMWALASLRPSRTWAGIGGAEPGPLPLLLGTLTLQLLPAQRPALPCPPQSSTAPASDTASPRVARGMCVGVFSCACWPERGLIAAPRSGSWLILRALPVCLGPSPALSWLKAASPTQLADGSRQGPGRDPANSFQLQRPELSAVELPGPCLVPGLKRLTGRELSLRPMMGTWSPAPCVAWPLGGCEWIIVSSPVLAVWLDGSRA